RDGTANAPVAEEEPDSALAAPPSTDARASAGELAPARTPIASPREAELARAHWVEGRVLFPPGTPADEKAVVVARGKKFADGGNHRVEVAPDGRFRVAFSEKTLSGQLTLEARYVYLAKLGRWSAKEPDAPVTLEPVLGARIEGRLVLPAGASLE